MKKTIGTLTVLAALALAGCTSPAPSDAPEPQANSKPTEAPPAANEKQDPKPTEDLAPNVTANDADSDIPKWSKINSCEGSNEFGQYGYNVELTLTNRADERMDFSAWIELLDEEGNRVIDNLASANGLEPGQSAKTSAPIANLDDTDLPKNLTCRVYEIEAVPSE